MCTFLYKLCICSLKNKFIIYVCLAEEEEVDFDDTPSNSQNSQSSLNNESQ